MCCNVHTRKESRCAGDDDCHQLNHRCAFYPLCGYDCTLARRVNLSHPYGSFCMNCGRRYMPKV